MPRSSMSSGIVHWATLPHPSTRTRAGIRGSEFAAMGIG
ncbi:MAG: hypothetical protein RL644_179 [Actinomycetota bacterium]